MENEEIYELANNFSDSIKEGQGKKAVNFIKEFLNMDIAINIKVVYKGQNEVFNNEELNYQAHLTYKEILDQLIAYGYEREKSEISARNSNTLENAINYYLTL